MHVNSLCACVCACLNVYEHMCMQGHMYVSAYRGPRLTIRCLSLTFHLGRVSRLANSTGLASQLVLEISCICLLWTGIIGPAPTVLLCGFLLTWQVLYLLCHLPGLSV